MEIRKCIMCSNESNGIILRGKNICLNCERNIINTNIKSKQYNEYVDKIKDALFYRE